MSKNTLKVMFSVCILEHLFSEKFNYQTSHKIGRAIYDIFNKVLYLKVSEMKVEHSKERGRKVESVL